MLRRGFWCRLWPRCFQRFAAPSAVFSTALLLMSLDSTWPVWCLRWGQWISGRALGRLQQFARLYRVKRGYMRLYSCYGFNYGLIINGALPSLETTAVLGEKQTQLCWWQFVCLNKTLLQYTTHRAVTAVTGMWWVPMLLWPPPVNSGTW